ncbi:hypothetical protein D3C87_1450210 [compost metagenome]
MQGDEGIQIVGLTPCKLHDGQVVRLGNEDPQMLEFGCCDGQQPVLEDARCWSSATRNAWISSSGTRLNNSRLGAVLAEEIVQALL